MNSQQANPLKFQLIMHASLQTKNGTRNTAATNPLTLKNIKIYLLKHVPKPLVFTGSLNCCNCVCYVAFSLRQLEKQVYISIPSLHKILIVLLSSNCFFGFFLFCFFSANYDFTTKMDKSESMIPALHI